ncbi:MAG TPA: GAF domain-containing protein, partial [Humisphaera sp.]|nr:GAF domain-containing protein [Humisphaera sp.]
KCLRRTDGSVDYFLALLQDITERKRSEKVLRESEALIAGELAAMKRLQELSTRLVNDGDKTSLLQEVIDAAIVITDTGMGNVQLLDRSTGALNIVASRGLSAKFLNHFSAICGHSGSCQAAMRDGSRVIVGDVTDSIFEGDDLAMMLAEGARAVQSTPLTSRSGEVLGILSTHYRRPHIPAERDLRILDLLARQAADWIERTGIGG